MHRFFIDLHQIAGPNVRFDDDQAHQMRRVLRLRPGDRVLALDGRGRQYEVALAEVTNARVMGKVTTTAEAAGEPAARLTLFQSLPRREKFEWVLQKGTEIGVARFAPVITRRSLVRDADDVTPEKLERWRRIVKEAAEQSGRGRLPELRSPISFGEALEHLKDYAKAIFLWERAEQGSMTTSLAGLPPAPAIALFIGPEGGYDEVEVDQARAAGAAIVSLGPRILRTETAAIVATALALGALGEMG
jgi:16S rRNA (uracil1498-N3)-methyltransferase